MRAGARGLFDRARQPFKALCRCIAVIHEGQFWANTEQIGYVIDAVERTLPGNVVNAEGRAPFDRQCEENSSAWSRKEWATVTLRINLASKRTPSRNL